MKLTIQCVFSTSLQNPMNDLPTEIFGCIFHHLDAFDAHRFGMTHHRAFQVINAERELAHDQSSQYHRWFDDVDKRMVVLVEKWSKVYAEDPECEYALSLQRDIQQCGSFYWGDELWQLITGTYYDGDDLDLESFAISMVEGYESVTINSCSGLQRCTVCGLRNTERSMIWEGAEWGYRIFDEHSHPKCLQCA